MRGISTTLVIVVTAIVILIAALVVLTIFSGGVGPIVDISEARSMCVREGSLACSTTGNLPPNWRVNTKYVGQERTPTSCVVLTGWQDCSQMS